jgi:hypothetical protein
MAEPAPQPSAQIDGRLVASFNTYDGMIDAMRERAQERRIALTSPEAAALANLPEYYIAKLLSVHPVRRIGMISLGPLLSVLGVKLLMVEDPEMMARMDRLALQKFGKPLKSRNESCVHNGAAITFRFSRRHMQIIGQKGLTVRWGEAARNRVLRARHAAHARWDKMTPSQRSAVNRKLARRRLTKAQRAEAKARGGEAK